MNDGKLGRRSWNPDKRKNNFLAVLLLTIALAALGCQSLGRQVPGTAGAVEGKARPSAEAPSEAAVPAPALAVGPVPSLAAPGFDSERSWSGYNDWEPAVAVDPAGNYVYQLTTRYGGPKACKRCSDPSIIFRRSLDGGATWEPDQFLAVTTKTQNDPQIEVANDNIYAVFLNAYIPGVNFTKSADFGLTWSDPVVFTGKGKKPSWSDKPVLAVSADGQHVYIAFNASDSYITASHNGGASFSAAVKTNNDSRYWFHTAGAVAPNGDVYFAATDYSQDYTGVSYIDVIRSTNGGATWQTFRADTSQEMPGCQWATGCKFGFLGPSAALAIDSSGLVMIAYNAGNATGAPQKLYAKTSSTGGDWSSPRIQVSEGGATVNNGFPALAAAPGVNDFRLAWQDDRNGATNRWNTWYRRSVDGGASWSPGLRLSDVGGGATYKQPEGYLFPYGDYFEIEVDAAGVNHVIWSEGSSWNGTGGSWYTRGQ